MGKILLTYDLEAKTNESIYSDVKNAMKDLGWKDRYNNLDVNEIWYLPNTSLWKPDSTVEQAKADMLACVKACKATLERFKAVEYTNWSGIKGKPYKS